jgi:hypothetical protein
MERKDLRRKNPSRKLLTRNLDSDSIGACRSSFASHELEKGVPFEGDGQDWKPRES